MSQVNFNGTIVATGQSISGTMDLPTARHPEMVRFSDIQDDDLVAGFDISENKTKVMDFTQLRSKLIGEGVPQTPVLNNGIIELTVDSVHVDNLRWDLPSIVGQEFTLERRGVGMLQTTEYNILSTGGFLLTGSSPVMKLGETFILTLTKLQGGDTEIIKKSGSLFSGMVPVTSSISWSDSHKGKIIAISGGTNKVTYTLPDLSDVEENTLIPFETNINNTYQSTIATTAGQLIYFGGTSYNQMYMGIGENLWLFNGTDGWYVVNAYGNYLTVGEPWFGYKKPPNTILAQGQLVRKDEYPRLWAFAQSLGTSLVTDTMWKEIVGGRQIRQGCFALPPAGSEDFFRVPALEGGFARWKGGIEPEARPYNYPGGLQGDEIRAHTHEWNHQGSNDNLGGSGYLATANGASGGLETSHAQVIATGGLETRPMNFGFLACIRC